MAQLTPAQRQAADRMINQTFANPAMQTQGWGAPTQSANAAYRPGISPSQLAAIHNVPPNAYQSPGPQAVNLPNAPYGSQYADTGNQGRATPEMQQLLALASAGGGRPPWTIPQPPSVQQANVQMPRPRPSFAPNWMDLAAMSQPQGANPGLGNAMLGNGQMNPGIPPQLPPADGSSPLPVWAGDNPQQAGRQPLNITVRGGQQPQLYQRANSTNGYNYGQQGGRWNQWAQAPWAEGMSPSTQYATANALGQMNAQNRQSNATGQAGGYQYQNGQKVGYAPINVGRGSYTPSNGAAAYALSNLAGQQAAQQRQATATGSTGVYNYKNGVKTGTVNGGSSAQAYEAAASKSRDKGTSGSGGNPSWW